MTVGAGGTRGGGAAVVRRESRHAFVAGGLACAARSACLSAASAFCIASLYCRRTTSTKARCSADAGATVRSRFTTTGSIGTVGVGLTAFGGAVILPYVTVFPGVGGQFVVLMFTVVVLGGLGSVAGAVAGGLAIGVIQALFAVHAETTWPWGLSQLQDQQLGGLILWVIGGFCLTTGALVVLAGYLSREDAAQQLNG